METIIKTNSAEARIIDRMNDIARDCGIALELERISLDMWEITINGERHRHPVILPQADLLLWEVAFGELDQNWSPFNH